MASNDERGEKKDPAWRARLHNIIYESDTAAGKTFDIILLAAIVISIVVVMLDSIDTINARYGHILYKIEWGFTILFTIEYILRLISIRLPHKYALSFFGIVDLLAVLPTYLSTFILGAQSLLVLRAMRLLRIFRIFRMIHFLSELRFLSLALINSLRKISIFVLFLLTIVVILGSIMYLIEDSENGFTSIPQSIYWAIVTITTVGYGDMYPATSAGKFIASIIMLLGYGFIAVPTGIVSTEMALAARKRRQANNACPNCGKEGHDIDAKFCKYCGDKL